MQNEPLSLRPAEAVNHVPAVQANLATWPWSAKINNAPNQARELVVGLGFAEVAVRPKFIALLNVGLLVRDAQDDRRDRSQARIRLDEIEYLPAIHFLRWFWSMTVNGPMTRSDRVATLEAAKAQIQKGWEVRTAWAKLEEVE